MFTDRQKLHQDKLVTSDAAEEHSFFKAIRPINRSPVQTPHWACRRSFELRVQAEIQVKSRGS
jgi:hypothetical protein